MKKEELLVLNSIVLSLKLPRLATERRVAWLQLATSLAAKATEVWAEKDAIAAADDIDHAEREKMWHVVLDQPIAAADGGSVDGGSGLVGSVGFGGFGGFGVTQDEIVEICQVNEQLTIGAQQLLINKLTQNEAQQ